MILKKVGVDAYTLLRVPIRFYPSLSQSISIHFSSFGPIQCTYLRMKKKTCKFWLRVLSIIWVISIVIIW